MEISKLNAEEALGDAERRSQFLALLAHELRNPLAPIRNAVQILRMSPDVSMGQHGRLLPMIERQLAHMARVLDDLLDVSRISNGDVELRKRSDRCGAGDAGRCRGESAAHRFDGLHPERVRRKRPNLELS